MSKSKRLLELMMTVNRRRKFTAGELAQEFGVSQRTILRDLQELSELGVPLYSEAGPHGGYRVLKERILPPIAFSEEEAVGIFFAIHALRHYSSLPFEAEFTSALSKFYQYMPEDVRRRIDRMKNRVDFITPARQSESPYLSILLDAAIEQKVLRIDYDSRRKQSHREIQPLGIYTRNGLWYCPAYCFLSEDFRVFRCDRMLAVDHSPSKPIHLQDIHLNNRHLKKPVKQEVIKIFAELTSRGVEACEAEPWNEPELHVREDGTGWLEGNIAKSDLPYFANFFIGLGHEVHVKRPPELLECIQSTLSRLMAKYRDF